MVLLGAIDQGTSSSRFLIFESDSGELVTSHQIEVPQIFPQPGWVEMDPAVILSSCVECVEKACANLEAMGISKDEIKAVGISNQRETTIVWNKRTGAPLHAAIVWMDTRTSDLAAEMIERTPTRNRDYFKTKTGLPLHPYFSVLKLKWLLENVKAVQEAHDAGELLFGTVDTWLIWNLTGGVHVTDVTNASRTLLLDLHKRKWSSELCAFFNIPTSVLPGIRSSAEIYGLMKWGALKGTAIAGCLGDQQSSLVGHLCLQYGAAKTTYGTGTFMLCNTGVKVCKSSSLLSTVAFQFGPHSPVCYALEGSGSIGGNVVRFLRDNLGFIQHAADVEALAASVSDTKDVYFVPSFTGLYSPYWDSTARGTICGLTQCSTRAHIARAALRAVAFQTAEMIEAIEHDLDGEVRVHTLKIDGGMTANKLFNQLQADILGRSIIVSQMAEISGWGAAIAAAKNEFMAVAFDNVRLVCARVFSDDAHSRVLTSFEGIGAHQVSLEEFGEHINTRMTQYQAQSTPETRDVDMLRWKEAVKRSRGWAHTN